MSDEEETETQFGSIVSQLLPRKNSQKKVEEVDLLINEDITITEYAPDVFEYLRLRDGFAKNSTFKMQNMLGNLKDSLSVEENRDAVKNAGESQGKSGSFFFFSHDNKFIIKTMFQDELDIMMESLPQYF